MSWPHASRHGDSLYFDWSDFDSSLNTAAKARYWQHRDATLYRDTDAAGGTALTGQGLPLRPARVTSRYMEAKGQIWLAAPPPVVWSSMTDPAVLKVCVPGCKRVEREANGHYRFDLEGRWGFLHARFHVQVWVHDLDPPDAATPQRYTLSAQGQGPLGLAKGQSRIELTEHAEGSYLVYAADGAPDERLGKVGRSALRRVADTLSQKFFRRFAETIVQNHPDEDSAATP